MDARNTRGLIMVDEHEDTVATPLVATNRRHPGDVVRVVVGAAILGVSVLAVYRDRVSVFETNLFRLGNDLPAAIGPYLNVIMQAGNVGAAPALAVVVLVIGRMRYWRAAFDVTVAGTLAWFGAKLVKDTIQRPRPGGLLDDVARFGSTEGLGFVSGHTAVAAALACAIAPYLPRGARRAVWAVPWLVGLGRVYFGAHLPLDIVGGAALGWMIGAAIHLALGAPHGAPTLDSAAQVLRAAGWRPRDLARIPGVHLGSFPFVATLDRGSVFVKLLDPDTRDRDLIIRAARIVSVRDVRDEAAVLDPPAQANREAAVTLLARQHDVRVPNVLAIARHPRERDLVWLVLEHVRSRDLGRVDPDEMTDALLDDLWDQVSRLHTAGVAHRELVASNILVDDDGAAWLVDFAHADSSPHPHALANDVAELLVSTSLLVGGDRAVGAAVRTLGPARVAEALPELAPLALTPQNRRSLRRGEHRGLLDDLREMVAERTESTRPTPSQVAVPIWGRVATAVGALGLVLAALVALAGPGDVVDELAAASPRWLGVAFVAWAIAALASTTSLVAAVERRLAVGRTAVVAAAAASAGASDGRRRADGIVVASLARSGVPPHEAERAIGRVRRAGWAGWAVVALAASVDALDHAHALVTPDHLALLVGLAAAATLVHLTLGAVGRHAQPGRRPGTAPGGVVGIGMAGWVPVFVAALVGSVAAVVSVLAAVTAVSADPVPISYAAVVGAAAWALVRAPGIDRAVSLRPVIVTAGLTASGAPLATAVAAAAVVGGAELVGLGLGAGARRWIAGSAR
jgi:glycosyltransferase 2 family protein